MTDIAPGSICHESTAGGTNSYLALSGIDADGHLRCVPIGSDAPPSSASTLGLR